jgi:hypothetical protein
MKRRDTEKAASSALGYLLASLGFVLVIFSFALGFLPFVDMLLESIGLTYLVENSGILLWGGIAGVVIGVFILVTSDIDVEEYE